MCSAKGAVLVVDRTRTQHRQDSRKRAAQGHASLNRQSGGRTATPNTGRSDTRTRCKPRFSRGGVSGCRPSAFTAHSAGSKSSNESIGDSCADAHRRFGVPSRLTVECALHAGRSLHFAFGSPRCISLTRASSRCARCQGVAGAGAQTPTSVRRTPAEARLRRRRMSVTGDAISGIALLGSRARIAGEGKSSKLPC
jgi:hypothetical protein